MTADSVVLLSSPMDDKCAEKLLDAESLLRVTMLEEQLHAITDKVGIWTMFGVAQMRRRETVICQLEEEIRAKEELVSEQRHLIEVLEAVHNNVKNETNEKQDTESLCSESEITVIENIPEDSSKPSNSDSFEIPTPPQCVFDEMERLRIALRRAMLDREKLELQNEQLLRQWEEALEYVQRQLQDEMHRNCELQEQALELKRKHHDMQNNNNIDQVCVSKDFAQFIGIFAAIIGLWLYIL